ncbi:MAG: large conductance mechanosensitive channel protein MscL [Clostridia bacterium]|nr:large conductance mechanosensitive channel protein MscL [Clostridia bacterium]
MKKDKKGFIAEFKEFIMRGNVIDMAIGVVIATAFGNITGSLVNNIIMPFITWIIGDNDFAKLDIVLKPEVTEVVDGVKTVVDEAVVLGIGTLLGTIFNFIIIAFIVFLIVKMINKMRAIADARKKKEEEAKEEEPKAPTTEELLSEILEEIKKK